MNGPSSRRTAIALALLLGVIAALVIVVDSARGKIEATGAALSRCEHQALVIGCRFSGDSRELEAARVIRAEFGDGRLGGCFLAIADRETGHTFNPRTANWHDHHSDGSVGSFGLVQIGALWRRPGETIEHFSLRMFDPVQNLRLAHRIYDRYGLAPWRSC